MSPYFDSYRKQVGADSDSRRGRIFSRREGGGLGEISGTSFFFFFGSRWFFKSANDFI
jgi:hypothetical protein